MFNELNYLEELTGLRAMQLATDFNEVEANEISLKMQIDWDRFLLSL